MGYSIQSVFMNTTNSYEQREATEPIIELLEGGVRTNDKYGKVTVIMEESHSYGDQVAMLNIFITDIYSLAAQNFYEALSLPIGSSMELPIKFQNEHGHLFARDIQGIDVGLKLSNPRIVEAQLDPLNQTINLRSVSAGECNIVIYLLEDPTIYDVFRVRVATLIQPSSPAQLHVGSRVHFKLIDYQNNLAEGQLPGHAGNTWSSSNVSVIEINHGTGEAVAREEGEAAVKYSNGMQAETVVRVAKVARVELAQANVMLSVEDRPEHGGARVRLRMFLRDQQEEMLPIYQYEGVNLIRQNVKVDCSSSHPGVVEAYGEVSDLEGYFCNVRYVGSASAADDNLYHKNTPKTVTVSVHVSSSTPNVARYSLNRFTSFQVKLNSKIYVERRCANGVHLDKDKRSTVIGVVSLSDFRIQSPFESSELVVEKSRENLDSNHFSVTVRVPADHNTPLSENLVLKSAVNDATVVSIPITFSPTRKAKKAASSPATPREQQKQATYDIDTKARRPASSAEESSQWT